MGQRPDYRVLFAASFGRRLLHDPNYLAVGALARAAWFEANLIATEFDGWFSEAALVARMTQALEFYTSGPEHTGLFPWNTIPRGVVQMYCIDPLLEGDPAIGGALIEENEERPGWYHIVGWEKYQNETPPKRRGEPKTSAQRQAEYRARRKAERAAVTSDVTPLVTLRNVTSRVTPVTSNARASVSSSSSSSSRPSRIREREERNVTVPTPVADALPGALKEKLAQYGYQPRSAEERDGDT